MRHTLPSFFAIAIFALSSGGACLPAIRAPAFAASTGSDGTGVADLVREINAARRKQHLRLLRIDERLCAIARSHALDMLSRKFFSHTNPDGLDPFARMKRANYRFGYAGENLAVDESLDSVARDFFDSPEHRENIMEPHYVRVGIGTVSSDDGEIVVEDFSD